MISRFKAYVHKQCCWGSESADKLVVKQFQHENSYHIKIISYTESRKTCNRTRYYTGGYIDDITQGPIPDPASYTVQYPPIYTEQTLNIPLPHSETIIICRMCNGNGRQMCRNCLSGYTKCPFCMISFFVIIINLLNEMISLIYFNQQDFNHIIHHLHLHLHLIIMDMTIITIIHIHIIIHHIHFHLHHKYVIDVWEVEELCMNIIMYILLLDVLHVWEVELLCVINVVVLGN